MGKGKRMVKDPTVREIIKAACKVYMEVILDEIQADPHQWSERPCSTCRTISSMVGKPFGCCLYAEQRKRSTPGPE